MYKIKRVNKFLVDVFHGEGWGNCCRLRKEQGKWQILKSWGKMPKNTITDIEGELK